MMSTSKIAIVISSTRAIRFGEQPARWIAEVAAQRGDLEVKALDLREYPTPFLSEIASNAWAPTQNAVARQWQQKVAAFDSYIFVTIEQLYLISVELQMEPVCTGVHI